MKIHLTRRDVNRIVPLLVQAAASGQKREGAKDKARKEGDSGTNGGGNGRQFDTRLHSGIYIEDSTGAEY
jgi:hypothetical protein